MPDWTKSMRQTFEYYIVDPGTWKDVKLLNNVKSSTITRDLKTETLGSASIDITESVGECYIRIYLVTIQNGLKEKFPLGTFLVQTPSSSFDGKIRSVSMDAYTPLLELKENPAPLGYSILKDQNIMDMAYQITRENARAPVIKASCESLLLHDFVANTDDTWLSLCTDLMSNAKYEYSLDEMGRILFSPKQDIASLQPVWTYDDTNSSILYPEISMDHDLYGIPNVVEVIYSNGNSNYYARVVNDDESSPLSTINRGREIIHRVTNPDLIGTPTEHQISEYTIQLLRELSSLEYTISYTHAYCPVRVGDCVRLNYDKSGITNIKAKVISQSIKCEPGCQVAEKAVFTAKLWNGKYATVTIKNNTTIVTGEGTGHKITVEDSVVFNYIIDHFQTTATEAGVWEYFRSDFIKLQKYFNSLQRVEAKNIEILNKRIGYIQSSLIDHKNRGYITDKVFDSLNSDIDKLYACTASYTRASDGMT